MAIPQYPRDQEPLRPIQHMEGLGMNHRNIVGDSGDNSVTPIDVGYAWLDTTDAPANGNYLHRSTGDYIVGADGVTYIKATGIYVIRQGFFNTESRSNLTFWLRADAEGVSWVRIGLWDHALTQQTEVVKFKQYFLSYPLVRARLTEPTIPEPIDYVFDYVSSASTDPDRERDWYMIYANSRISLTEWQGSTPTTLLNAIQGVGNLTTTLNTGTGTGTGTATTSTPAPASGNLVAYIAGGAVILLLLIVFLVQVLSKKSHDKRR